MRRDTPAYVLVLAFAMESGMAVGATYSVAGLSDTVVAQGLASPTDFDWLPGGRMLVLEKTGTVRIVIGGALQVTPALDWTANVNSVGERGLLGVCVDPAFSTNGFVYLYYSTTTPNNRISRFHMVGNALDPTSELVVLDNIDATNSNHNGGTILIGPDGKLWAAPGDSGTGGAKSQDITTGKFNGKVLRMNLDGSVPTDNPFASVSGVEPRIWAFGFRNPFRFSFRPPPNNTLFVADVGQSAREELDAIATPSSTPPGTGGGNYGWPCREGFLPFAGAPLVTCNPPLLDPIFDYDRTVGATIIGGVFVTSPSYPAAIQGKYLFGDNAQSWLRTLDITANNQVNGALQNVATGAEGPVAFKTGPDGLVYFAAIVTGRIYRINPLSTSGLGAPTVTFPANGSTLTASTQMLTWTAVAPVDPGLALSYEVLLTDIATGKTELQITVPDLSTIYSLHSSTQYQLMVRACQTVCGPFSAPVSFAVTLPPVPTGTPGIVGCSVAGGNSLTCNWNAVTNADLYDFHVVQPPPAGPGGGALTVAARVVSATAATLPVPAGIADVIVSACNGDGCGPFSSPVRINPAGPNPTAASLGTPLGGSVVSGPTVMFSWNRVPGDNGGNTIYRLFVQDLSRQSTALDVHTTQNFWAAFFKAEGTRYDALVVARPGPSQVVGPAQGFNVSGVSASAPTMVSPGHQSSVAAGIVQVGWTPVLGAGLYQYYIAAQVAGGPVVTGVTPALTVQVPLGMVGGVATLYSGIARACPSNLSCTMSSDAGWGPWSNAPGGPGVTNFTVTP